MSIYYEILRYPAGIYKVRWQSKRSYPEEFSYLKTPTKGGNIVDATFLTRWGARRAIKRHAKYAAQNTTEPEIVECINYFKRSLPS